MFQAVIVDAALSDEGRPLVYHLQMLFFGERCQTMAEICRI